MLFPGSNLFTWVFTNLWSGNGKFKSKSELHCCCLNLTLKLPSPHVWHKFNFKTQLCAPQSARSFFCYRFNTLNFIFQSLKFIYFCLFKIAVCLYVHACVKAQLICQHFCCSMSMFDLIAKMRCVASVSSNGNISLSVPCCKTKV